METELRENEVIGADGLIHCAICGRAKQMIIHMFGDDTKVRCICDCDKKKMAEREAREKREETERRRSVCFSQTNMKSWNFDNDDNKNPKLSNAMKRYCEQFKEFKKESKGLLLYGTVGTGKTYYAACIANELIDKGYDVLLTNFATLTNRISGMYEGKQEYIDSLNRYKLLIIDDLGAERNSPYMQELVFNLIDSRYRSGLPMIITTNLTASELKAPKEIGYARIYDRILERCFPVEVTGESRRRRAVIENFAKDKERLGL